MLELGEIVDYAASKEGGAIRESRFVDDEGCALRLNTLHDALDGRLTEVVGVGLHGETIHADNDFMFAGLIPGTVVGVASSHFQNAVSDEVLSGPVGFHDGGHHVLGDVLEVGQELLGVLG